MWKRIILILVVLACLAGGAWWLYGDKRTPSDVLTLYGNVDIRQVDVAFRVGGRITELYKEEGDTVKAGEKLAQLDLQPLEYALSRAQAELAMQQAAYAQMLNGYRPEDVAQARASLEGAQAAFNNAAITLRRTENLRKQRALSQRELDDARSAYTEALSRRDAAQEQLRLIKAAEAAVRTASLNVSDTELFAPQDGVVLTRVHEVGAVVQPGQTVYAVTLNNPVWIRAYVTQPNLGHIRPGQEALLSIDATPGKTYCGFVGFISPTAEFTPKTVETKEVRNDLVFRFRVVAEDPDNVMRQGMPVTVTLRKDGGRP